MNSVAIVDYRVGIESLAFADGKDGADLTLRRPCHLDSSVPIAVDVSVAANSTVAIRNTAVRRVAIGMTVLVAVAMDFCV